MLCSLIIGILINLVFSAIHYFEFDNQSAIALHVNAAIPRSFIHGIFAATLTVIFHFQRNYKALAPLRTVSALSEQIIQYLDLPNSRTTLISSRRGGNEQVERDMALSKHAGVWSALKAIGKWALAFTIGAATAIIVLSLSGFLAAKRNIPNQSGVPTPTATGWPESEDGLRALLARFDNLPVREDGSFTLKGACTFGAHMFEDANSPACREGPRFRLVEKCYRVSPLGQSINWQEMNAVFNDLIGRENFASMTCWGLFMEADIRARAAAAVH